MCQIDMFCLEHEQLQKDEQFRRKAVNIFKILQDQF